MTRVIIDTTHQTHLALSAHKLKFLEASKNSKLKAHEPSPLDREIDDVKQNLNHLQSLFDEQYGSNASDVNTAIGNLQGALNQAKAAANSPTPFDFLDGIAFSFNDGIFALGAAISGLLAMQPGLIAGEMAISTELVSARIQAWSKSYLGILQYDEGQIAGAGGNTQTLDQWQGQMSVDNAANSAISTALNGVQSMLTSGTSSKTSTYQTLIQQASSVVTALLNAMTQNWV